MPDEIYDEAAHLRELTEAGQMLCEDGTLIFHPATRIGKDGRPYCKDHDADKLK